MAVSSYSAPVLGPENDPPSGRTMQIVTHIAAHPSSCHAPHPREWDGIVLHSPTSRMFVRNFSSSCFLRNVFGTQPFIDYCEGRGIALTQVLSAPMQKQDLRQWVSALTQLPSEQQAAVEMEL